MTVAYRSESDTVMDFTYNIDVLDRITKAASAMCGTSVHARCTWRFHSSQQLASVSLAVRVCGYHWGFEIVETA